MEMLYIDRQIALSDLHFLACQDAIMQTFGAGRCGMVVWETQPAGLLARVTKVNAAGPEDMNLSALSIYRTQVDDGGDD